MTKSERRARLDAFMSDDSNFIAVAYDDPRAVALRNKAAARNKRTAAARAAAEAVSHAAAATFDVGQRVKVAFRPVVCGVIVSIKGDFVTLDNGRTFAASALVGA